MIDTRAHNRAMAKEHRAMAKRAREALAAYKEAGDRIGALKAGIKLKDHLRAARQCDAYANGGQA